MINFLILFISGGFFFFVLFLIIRQSIDSSYFNKRIVNTMDELLIEQKKTNFLLKHMLASMKNTPEKHIESLDDKFYEDL